MSDTLALRPITYEQAGEQSPWSHSDDPATWGLCWQYEQDGQTWFCVVLPDNAGMWSSEWPCTIPGTNKFGDRWTVTGEFPNVTVTPSIHDPQWHGWIRDGKLVKA